MCENVEDTYDILCLYEEYTGESIEDMESSLCTLLISYLSGNSIKKLIYYINECIEYLSARDLGFFVYVLEYERDENKQIHFEFKNNKVICVKGA